MRQSTTWYAVHITIMVAAIVTFICCYGCGGPVPQSGAVDQRPEFVAAVNGALDEIERHGLPEWAAWGRENIRWIGEDVSGLIPEGNLGYVWAFTDMASGEVTRIVLLGEAWLALDADDRGMVLLHELYHVRTGDLGHSGELDVLLSEYEAGG